MQNFAENAATFADWTAKFAAQEKSYSVTKVNFCDTVPLSSEADIYEVQIQKWHSIYTKG